MILNHMVDHAAQLDSIFRALSDPTRRAMLESLRARERSIMELAEPFDMSLAGAAKHVQVLDRAGLITRRKQGRTQYCRLNSTALQDAHDWLQQYAKFWDSRLDKLDEILKSERKRGKKK